jgi:uncharacterized OB-fold protein
MADAKTDAKPDENQPIVLDRMISLTYTDLLPEHTVRFVERLLDGQITGRKCPVCGQVYAPPKGYCPVDVVALTPEHEVEVGDHGVVTGFTIITPVRYYGQTKTEPFIYASVLLDGANTPLGGQEITGISIDDVRIGLRVKAVWKPVGERSGEGQSTRGWGSVEGCIDTFEWTGEPDADFETFQEHVA